MISVIATVRNEGDNMHRLLDSLVGQTRQPDEIVISDGGSSDNTVAVIESYEDRLPLRVIAAPGANISAGRNIAIDAARGDIIAATDAGVVLARDWLERLTEPLLTRPDVNVVSGFFHADAHNVFEAALGATTLPLVDEIDPDTFLPSSRSVAFRKAAWGAVAGYPEWLDFCEDLIFDLRLKQLTAPVFAPGAIAYFRPRTSLRAFFKQYYLYARGDGKADLWRKRHAARYLTYLVAVPGIAALGLLVHPAAWGLYLLGGAVYLRQPYRRLPHILRGTRRDTPANWLYAAGLIPVIRVTGDIAKMLGYPAGWRWRLRENPPDWRQVDVHAVQ